MDSGYFNSPIIKKRTEYIENALKKLYEDPSSITADEMKVALDEMTDQDEVLKVYNDFMCKLLRSVDCLWSIESTKKGKRFLLQTFSL